MSSGWNGRSLALSASSHSFMILGIYDGAYALANIAASATLFDFNKIYMQLSASASRYAASSATLYFPLLSAVCINFCNPF
jgi:hypothetical protein